MSVACACRVRLAEPHRLRGGHKTNTSAGVATLLGRAIINCPVSGRGERISIIPTQTTGMHTLSPESNPTLQALSLVGADMREVDRVIQERLHSEVELIGQVARYIISAGGKRVRPALLLLMCGALDCEHPQRHSMAAVVEFIHTATLLHDDVVDESTLRRGRSTANEVFGNAASVLVGDFLYTRAFQMMVAPGDLRILDVLAEATNVIAEGEVWQLMNMHDATLDEAGYLRVIRAKTAKLFEASARLAAILAGADAELEARCADYGQALGAAFQVVDDVLDYEGNATELGKNLGDDLREGKMTLPLICTLRHCTPAQAGVIRDAIEQGNTERLDDIIQIVRSCGGLSDARRTAQAEAQRAVDAALALPVNKWSKALVQLASALLERRS